MGDTRGVCYNAPLINKLNNNQINYIMMITKKQAEHLLSKMQDDNRMFSVSFIKKNGDRRTMLARFGVTKYLKNKGARYNPADYDLFTVFDMNKQSYRSIPINRLLWLRTKGKRYYVSK